MFGGGGGTAELQYEEIIPYDLNYVMEAWNLYLQAYKCSCKE